jgi:glucan phosphoethanolaminetransferase (alkaline phosphatase superfamily)
MSWEYVILALIVIAVVLLIVCRDHPLVKKYWKYTLIAIPLVVLLILKIISDIKSKPAPDEPDPLAGKIQDLKDDLVEAQMTSAVEIAAAKEKNKEALEKLEEIKLIPDKAERLKKLAAMIG